MAFSGATTRLGTALDPALLRVAEPEAESEAERRPGDGERYGRGASAPSPGQYYKS